MINTPGDWCSVMSPIWRTFGQFKVAVCGSGALNGRWILSHIDLRRGGAAGEGRGEEIERRGVKEGFVVRGERAGGGVQGRRVAVPSVGSGRLPHYSCGARPTRRTRHTATLLYHTHTRRFLAPGQRDVTCPV